MGLYVFNRVALIFVWYELHSASPPVSCSISSICPGSSRTYTLKPSDSNCLLRRTCKGRNVLPGALTSTNAILPPGKRTMRSGTPSYPGDMNFSAKPPIALVALVSFDSIILSCMCFSCVPKTQKSLYARIYAFRVPVAISYYYIPYIRKDRNMGTKSLVCFAAAGVSAVPMNCSW